MPGNLQQPRCHIDAVDPGSHVHRDAGGHAPAASGVEQPGAGADTGSGQDVPVQLRAARLLDPGPVMGRLGPLVPLVRGVGRRVVRHWCSSVSNRASYPVPATPVTGSESGVVELHQPGVLGLGRLTPQPGLGKRVVREEPSRRDLALVEGPVALAGSRQRHQCRLGLAQ